MKPYGTRTVAKCLRRVRDGESMRAVAKSLNVDPQTVRNWCLRAGVESQHNRRWTDAEIEQLADMWSRGMKTKEIATKLGRTTRSVERYVVKHRDIAPHRRRAGMGNLGEPTYADVAKELMDTIIKESNERLQNDGKAEKPSNTKADVTQWKRKEYE